MTTGSLRNRLFLAAVVFFFCGSMISMQALEETDSVQDAASVMEVLVEDDGAISVVVSKLYKDIV